MTNKIRKIGNSICWYLVILLSVFIIMSGVSLYNSWNWNLALVTWFIFLLELLLIKQSYEVWRDLKQ